jgi:hypothetical protein
VVAIEDVARPDLLESMPFDPGVADDLQGSG